MPFISVHEPQRCCNDAWEAAYLAFETRDEEIRKFTKRLERAGAHDWPRDAQIVELFCGRGNGLAALERIGFHHLEGVNLSESLLCHYDGPAKTYLCDCRRLPFDNHSRDIIIIHGGLHHLPTFPDDVASALREAARVLRPNGTLLVVEPWQTPFLALVEWASHRPMACRLYRKLDALATMNLHERQTYDRWLSHPAAVLRLLAENFYQVKRQIRFGKLLFVGSNRTGSAGAREASG